jgi:hypothetical protein
MKRIRKPKPFQWDYSYFKWQDIPVEVRREITLARSWAARTWVYGRTSDQMDVPHAAARELYNANWDGCRDLWKEQYRYKHHPESAPPPRYAQTKFINWFSGSYMTVEDPPVKDSCGELPQPALPPEPPISTNEFSESMSRAAERERAYGQRFNARQQKRYEAWQRRMAAWEAQQRQKKAK